MKTIDKFVGKVIQGDCLKIMKEMPEKSIDLIYIDPPFFSNRNHMKIQKSGEMRSFKDEWKGGINVYIDWMKQRVIEFYRILKSTGSFYLHCDWHAGHYLKVMCDKIFGYNNFRNEIIWRIGWVSGYKTQKIGWIRNHDTILYYVKSKDFVFNKEYIPYAHNYIRYGYNEKPSRKGIPIEDTWNCNVNDVLNSIMIKSFSKEKKDYPTQKPESLLRRIIKASSNKCDIVLDSFCGSGTTLKVAQELDRKWIGIEINLPAIRISNERINKEYSQLKLF